MSKLLEEVVLPDGRTVQRARHRTGVLDLAAVVDRVGDDTRWPDLAWARWPTLEHRGHLLTYDGFATRLGIIDDDLREAIISVGNRAEATTEDSLAFGSVVEAALAEQARRRGDG